MICSATLLLAPVSVAAPPTEADREKARALAAEGYEALQKKDYAQAEDCFRRADKIVHAPTLVVDWARSLVGLGRLVEAHERYELVLREGVPDNSPWSWKRAEADAEREIAVLKPRLAWVTVSISGSDRPALFIDGKRVPDAAIGVPRAVNPGRRTISARAVGYVSKQVDLDLGEGKHETLELAIEPKPKGAVEEDEPIAPAVLDELPPPVYVAPGSLRRTSGYIAMTVGGVGLVAGTVSGVLAMSAGSDLEEMCGPTRTCVPKNQQQKTEYEQTLDRYSLFKTASTIGLTVGVVGVAAGAYLLFIAKDPVPGASASRAPRLVPLLGPTTVGVAGTF